MKEMGGAFNQNTDVFRASFESVDRRMYSIMRVLSDMYFYPGKIHLKVQREVFKDDDTGESYIHAGRALDWMQYFAEYDAMLGFVVLAETHCTPRQELPDNVVIFGGED